MQVVARLRLVLAAGVVLAASLALAQDKPAAPAGGQPPAMSAEEQAMMQKWQAFMTPGEQHKMLAGREGSWTTKVTAWMVPGAPPSTSEGSSECKMSMDGRYLEETAQGSFGGMPFMGHGITGYDNMKKKFVSTWIDNMGTGIMMSTGSYDPKTKTITSKSMEPDVMTGKDKHVKMVEKLEGPDQRTMEMYDQTPDGKGWRKTMEIVYTRKK